MILTTVAQQFTQLPTLVNPANGLYYPRSVRAITLNAQDAEVQNTGTTAAPFAVSTGDEAVFRVIEYRDRKNPVHTAAEITVEKTNIRWVMWVDDPLMNGPRDFIIVENKTEVADFTEDFTQALGSTALDKATYVKNLKDHGYTYASNGIETVSGTTYNQLNIKFSKWLDSKTIYIEAFRNFPDHNPVHDYTIVVNPSITTPEITAVYWESLDTQKINRSGFNQTVNLVVESLGVDGANMTVELFDDDSGIGINPSDPIPWTGIVLPHPFTITQRRTLVPYQILPVVDYATYISDDSNNEVELYVELTDTTAGSTLLINNPYAELILTEEARPITAFVGRRIVDGINITYEKIDRRYNGEEAYLVAECSNIDGDTVTFRMYENNPVVVLAGAANNEVPFLEPNGTQTNGIDNFIAATSVDAVVTNGYAAARMKFQARGQDLFNTWNDRLFPTDANNERDFTDSEIYIQVTHNTNQHEFLNAADEFFKLRASVIRYRIYHSNAVIAKTVIDKPELANFIYHDGNNNEHNVCTCAVIFAESRNKGIILLKKKEIPSNHSARFVYTVGDCKRIYHFPPGTPHNDTIYASSSTTSLLKGKKISYTRNFADGLVELVEMPNDNFNFGGNAYEGLNYESNLGTPNAVLLRFSYYNTSRRYCNLDVFAAFIGVLGEGNNIDVEVTGMCFKDATCHPSVSHHNGYSIDTRYLCQNQVRGCTGGAEDWACRGNYDTTRQNAFGNAFKKFHFGTRNTLKGSRSRYSALYGKADSTHNDHYHCGSFNDKKVTLIIE